jgi:hypothetical protein
MGLETELRGRIENSLRELEVIVESLHHVRRLADTQQASAEQLARVAHEMGAVGGRLTSVTERVGETGTILQSAVDAVKNVDARTLIDRIDAVTKMIKTAGAGIDSSVTMLHSAKEERSTIQTSITTVASSIEVAKEANTVELGKLERALAENEAVARGRIEQLVKRVRVAAIAAWTGALFAGLAAAGVILQLVA